MSGNHLMSKDKGHVGTLNGLLCILQGLQVYPCIWFPPFSSFSTHNRANLCELMSVTAPSTQTSFDIRWSFSASHPKTLAAKKILLLKGNQKTCNSWGVFFVHDVSVCVQHTVFLYFYWKIINHTCNLYVYIFILFVSLCVLCYIVFHDCLCCIVAFALFFVCHCLIMDSNVLVSLSPDNAQQPWMNNRFVSVCFCLLP